MSNSAELQSSNSPEKSISAGAGAGAATDATSTSTSTSTLPPQPTKTILTSRMIEAFALTYLYKNFDEAKPTPQFHRESWALYASDAERACVIAPRGHAKSSALTHVYGLAAMLFRLETYAIIISTNEELAIEHLGDITRELTENEELIEDFEIKGLVVSSKTEIIVEFLDGAQFRLLARGSGQKMRGRKWRGGRPGLIICDDLEDDEQVENKERRDKFRKWFNRAVIPALRRGGKLRIHGTVLHEDALLPRFRKQSGWKVLFYKAHKSYDDFAEILWPEQFTEEGLRAVRQRYIEDFDAPGYSQEYLNSPFDSSDAYLRQPWFLGMTDADFQKEMKIAVGVDFAVSKADKANRSSLTVGGLTATNTALIIDQRVGRWDTEEIIDTMIDIQQQHDPICFFVEDGVIWKALEPMLNKEMRAKDCFMLCIPMPSVKDKAVRGRSLRKRMRSQSMLFDKEADWYAEYEAELLRFTGYSDAVLDDQFDSTAILSRGFDDMPILDEEDFMTDDELTERHMTPKASQGRSTTTGY